MTLPSLSKLTTEQVNRMCAEAIGWRCLCGHDWIAPGEPLDSTFSQELPNYATDPASALTLCESLADEDWVCDANMGLDRSWEVEFSRPVTNETAPDDIGTRDGEKVEIRYGFGAFPLAICHAYLKAKNLATE